jgi:hypothetical protein
MIPIPGQLAQTIPNICVSDCSIPQALEIAVADGAKPSVLALNWPGAGDWHPRGQSRRGAESLKTGHRNMGMQTAPRAILDGCLANPDCGFFRLRLTIAWRVCRYCC